MKFYDLNSVFMFGKNKGKTLREVLDHQASYINWCAINVDFFYIAELTIEDIKKVKPNFYLTKEAIQKLADKFNKYKQKIIQEIESDIDIDSGLTFEKYNGSYAQDVEGWSDQDIDEVFGRDPLMYWNID